MIGLALAKERLVCGGPGGDELFGRGADKANSAGKNDD